MLLRRGEQSSFQPQQLDLEENKQTFAKPEGLQALLDCSKLDFLNRKQHKPKMLMNIPLLIFLIGSLPFCALAEEASTPVSEDETATADLGDSMVSEVPTEGVMTTDSVLSTSEDGENATDPGVPETSDDGLETATLIGIIIGIIVAIGVATGIIITVVKKVSGRR